MSGFPPTGFTVRTSRLRPCNKVIGALPQPHCPRSRSSILPSGASATLRAFAPHLPALQIWKVADNDLDPWVGAADAFHPRAGVTTTPIDLVRDLKAAIDSSLDPVTTSALLDLVSDSWLQRLVTDVAARRLPFYGR
jgi:hypothetical protein